mmetsp:Transcript_17143/g.37411  ORF Transcript_17143/g.37411 Transcript_17143/m.37411 type:complete len:219 (+) Transcript_17143:1313-1969(+)
MVGTGGTLSRRRGLYHGRLGGGGQHVDRELRRKARPCSSSRRGRRAGRRSRRKPQHHFGVFASSRHGLYGRHAHAARGNCARIVARCLVHFCLFLVARAHGFGQGSACRKEASHVGIGQAGRTRVWLDLYGVYGSLRLWWNHCSDSTTSGHQALDTHCQSFLVQRQGPPRSFGRLGPSHGGRVFGRHVLLCGGPHVVGTLPGIRTARLFTNPLCLLHL